MRQYYFVLLFCLFQLTDLVAAGDPIRVIEHPAVEFSTTSRFEISKIELSDTETRITLSWSLQPGWWVTYGDDTWIEDVDSKERYVIKSLADATFAEKVYVDDEGKLTNVLIFPPLKKGVKKIDYNNQFYGVSLLETANTTEASIPVAVEKWIDDELAKVTKEPLKDFESDDFFKRSTGRLVGFIKGYDKRAGFETGIIYVDNEFLQEDYPLVVEVHPDGRFEADIPLNHPISQFMVMNNRFIYFYLEPEQTVALILDWKDFLKLDQVNGRDYPAENIEYRGKLARINKEVFSFPKLEYDYQEYSEKMGKISHDEMKRLILDEKQQYEQKLEEHIAAHDFLEKSEIILRESNDVIGTMRVLDYLMDVGFKKRTEPNNEILTAEIPYSYYSFLQDFPLNKQSMLIDSQVKSFINRFEFLDPLSFYANPKMFKPEIYFKEYLENEGIELTEEERKLLEPQSFSMDQKDEMEEFNKKMIAFNEKYSDKRKTYTDKYVTPFLPQKNEIDFMEPWRKKDSVLTNHLKLQKSLFYDITKTRRLKSEFDRIKDAEQAYKYWDALKATIESDFVKSQGQLYVESKFQDPDAPQQPEGTMQGFKVMSEAVVLPDGKAKELFYNIADKYKGKIVFLDFWATTCGPCVGSIKSMKEIRAKHKGNPDFEFVFITSERDSPEDRYNSFIEEQEMENAYRVDTDTYNRFRQLFKFNGIPRYVVLDKNGDVIDGDFEMYNFTYKLPKILELYK